MKPVTIDFETFGIEGRPDFPPKPVGVSIKYWGKPAHYYAWGHPTGNNCTKKEAWEALIEVWQFPLLFQNGKFDVDVADVHMELYMPEWDKIHDTMFLLFLNDPHQQELGLKFSADLLLGRAADEQDEVRDWLVKHQPVEGVKISMSKKSPNTFAKYIAYAPGDLVGKYANADTTMTEQLFELLYPKIIKRGMSEAYDRERRLMPCLLDMERQGVRVDLLKLRKDVSDYGCEQILIDKWIKKTIKADINLDSGDQLIDAMVKAGKVDTKKMVRTKKSKKLSTAKDSLLLGVTDKHLLAMLTYRAALNTCMSTFMEPWLKTAEKGGLIYTNWNQVRAENGARTGRLSSNPNFQNIPNPFEVKDLPIDLPSLPRIREYIIPFEGDVLIDRDYSQQEPRILAHFTEGNMMTAYKEEPWIDVHAYAQESLHALGLFYERKPVKATNLGIIYGMGYKLLSEKTGLSIADATTLKKSLLRLYPGIQSLNSDLKERAKHKLPFRTWGGRQVYCEPPKIVDKKIKTYDYKMLNYLIQGSAADCTKEALIRYYEDRISKTTKIILNVHDELVVSAPKMYAEWEMSKLQKCMESVEFDVPMLSEGDVSDTSWDDLKPYDRKGEMV